MKKFMRLLSVLLIILMLAGCAPKTPDVQGTPEQSTGEGGDAPEQTLYENSLTGEAVLESEEQTKLRPVAVMVNNQNDTRCHQIGLGKADIVYETYVEGGITRTLAIYKDLTGVGEIGTLRSARYDFVDIACSHDALYIHNGLDPTYCQPYIKKLGLDSVNMLEGRYYGYTYRTENGHILEHTLYSTSEKLLQMIADHNMRMTVKEDYAKSWQNFADTPKSLSGGTANAINVTFSADYKDRFEYDSAKGAYTKAGHRDGQKHFAAYDESLDFKNVVVLFTTLGDMGNGYRVNVGLESGSGYYFSQGTYQEIKWEKGSTYDSFVFKDADGNALEYNPGNSWVCLVSRDMKSKFSIE